MVTKKVYRTRKKCIHFNPPTSYDAGHGSRRCYAKMGTWFCKGVSCSWYKEKK